MSFFRALYNFLLGFHGFQVPDEDRRKAALVFGLALAVVVGITAFKLGAWSALDVATDSPQWENALQARTIGFRIKVGLGLVAGVMALAYGLFQLLDRTRAGKRLMHWDETADNEYTAASKTFNSGLVFAAILLGLFILAAGVLR